MRPNAFRNQVMIVTGASAVKVFLEPVIRRAKAAQAKMKEGSPEEGDHA